jgi:hypothetical protein
MSLIDPLRCPNCSSIFDLTELYRMAPKDDGAAFAAPRLPWIRRRFECAEALLWPALE